MNIVFRPEVYKRFRAYVLGCPVEISGFGKVTKTKDTLFIEDVKIFQQQVNEVHTELNALAVAKFFDDLQVAGEDPGDWKLWWHSHVTMQAAFSTIDHDTIDEFDMEVPNDNWMLSIVTNKQGALYCQADIYAPIRCTIGGLPYDVEVGDPALIVDVAKEIEQKVTILYSHQQSSFYNPKQQRILTPQERKRLANLFPHLHFPPLPGTSLISIEEGEIIHPHLEE